MDGRMDDPLHLTHNEGYMSNLDPYAGIGGSYVIDADGHRQPADPPAEATRDAVKPAPKRKNPNQPPGDTADAPGA